MDNEYEIQLSGPFDVVDSSGRVRKAEAIHIFDEGYGSIDVYVTLMEGDDDARLHEDAGVIAGVMARLRSLGYAGPDLRPGADDLQDSLLVVLEAPEEFGRFATVKGWRNIADDYPDEESGEALAASNEDAARGVYGALMKRLGLG